MSMLSIPTQHSTWSLSPSIKKTEGEQGYTNRKGGSQSVFARLKSFSQSWPNNLTPALTTLCDQSHSDLVYICTLEKE